MKKKPFIQTRKQFYPFDLKKYLTVRNGIIFLILLVLYLIFPQYMSSIVLMFIFYPISMFTVKATKYIRGMGIETITAFTLFLGIVYGWKIALFFGLVIGSFIWAQAGINLFTIVQCILNGLCAFIGAWVAGWGIGSFMWTYIVAATIRNVLAFIIFIPIQPDPVKNFSHTACDIIWNTLLLSHILNALYGIVSLVLIR